MTAPAPKARPDWVKVPLHFTGFADEYATRKLDHLMSPAAFARLLRDTRAARKELLPLAKFAVFGDKRTDTACRCASGSRRSAPA
jgi:hypothetical protein